jgi:hypothetical protein
MESTNRCEKRVKTKPNEAKLAPAKSFRMALRDWADSPEAKTKPLSLHWSSGRQQGARPVRESIGTV